MKFLLASAPARGIVLALFLIVIIGTAMHNYREIHDKLTAQVLMRKETAAQLTAITLSEKFGRILDIGVSLATRVKVRELVSEGKWVEASAYLHDVNKEIPYIERLFLADINGVLKADVPALPNVRGVNFSYREWYKGVSRKWQPYITSVYTQAAQPRINVFAVSTPIRGASGKVMGVLVLQIRIATLLDWVRTTGIGPEAYVYVVDSKGQLVFDTRHPMQASIGDMGDRAVMRKMQESKKGVDILFDEAEQRESIVAFVKVPGYGWSVIAEQPTSASLGLTARDEQLQRILIGYGLILLLGTVTLLLMSRLAATRQRAVDERIRKIEHEQTEQALREKDRLLTAVGAMAKVGGWEFDTRTGKGTWTDEVARIHDMDPGDETNVEKGMSFYQGESRIKIEKAVQDAIGQAKPYDLELEIVTASGNHKWVRTIGEPVMENGVVVKVWGSFQDITERKRVEEEIRQLNAELETRVAARTSELEAANKELEAFSYSVSHDLRAPLRAIDGFSQVLLEDYSDKLDAYGLDCLARVRAATVRMGHLIDDMLELSRVTRAEMNRSAVNLSAMAETVIGELKRNEPDRQVECSIQSGLEAEGDPRLLRIALMNLLANAWKFTGRQSAPHIDMGVMNTNGKQIFYVSDNGTGFDMAHAGKLFGAFQRLHAASEFPGTGVGLATVQRIVHRHGGTVWAEAAVDRGATFYFTLDAVRMN